MLSVAPTLCALALISERPPAVFIEPIPTSTIANELAIELAPELPDEAIVASFEPATLIVRIEELDGVLRLTARRKSGAIVVERSVSLAGGRKPALRVAVLLVRKAIDAELESEPEPSPPPPIEIRTPTVTAAPPIFEDTRSPLELAIIPLTGVSTWQAPFGSPQLAFGAAVRAKFGGALEWSVRAMFAGHVCCAKTSDDVEVDRAREIQVAAGVGLPIARGDRFTFGADVAGGLEVISGDARGGSIFVGPGTPYPFWLLRGVLLGSLFGGVAIAGGIEARIHVGGRIGSASRELAAPRQLVRPAGSTPSPLELGFVTPYATFGVVIPIF